MGMEQQVTFSAGGCPAWSAVAELLTRHGFAVPLRMIDGELAFPDEAPPEAWRELRVGTPAGMVTARRAGGGVALVTWGNADEALRAAWNALTWAFAAAGGGQVVTPDGALEADEFRRRGPLPSCLS